MGEGFLYVDWSGQDRNPAEVYHLPGDGYNRPRDRPLAVGCILFLARTLHSRPQLQQAQSQPFDSVLAKRVSWSVLEIPDGTDKRDTAIEIRRALSDLPVCKDIVVATPEEVDRRGHFVGTLLRSALREGKVLYERS